MLFFNHNFNVEVNPKLSFLTLFHFPNVIILTITVGKVEPDEMGKN